MSRGRYTELDCHVVHGAEVEMTETRHFDDLQFTAVVENHEHHADFTVYQIIGTLKDGKYVYDKKDSDCTDPVENLTDAQIYLHGSVKWDGCSNWNFDEQDRVMLHFCRKEQAANIGILFSRLYEWANELGQDRL